MLARSALTSAHMSRVREGEPYGFVALLIAIRTDDNELINENDEWSPPLTVSYLCERSIKLNNGAFIRHFIRMDTNISVNKMIK